ncbi:hypothetical protein COCON_G00008560 [Conger conger]|uniref:Uncharacterized protein n=1 Tax=Conger conger TaxID=82655 RepID=A0A9Q1E230_CONCO|nr:hypothetical protein COCON_G00008560 [Conger conger]
MNTVQNPLQPKPRSLPDPGCRTLTPSHSCGRQQDMGSGPFPAQRSGCVISRVHKYSPQHWLNIIDKEDGDIAFVSD